MLKIPYIPINCVIFNQIEGGIVQKDKTELYDYYIHYNPYTGYWNAFKRDVAVNYLNGTLKDGEVMKSKSIDDLVKYISFTKKKATKAKHLNEH